MVMGRLTRLTNATSKKIENNSCAIALHFFCYNFFHKNLSVTPAIQARLTKKPMIIQDIIMLADYEGPKTRGS